MLPTPPDDLDPTDETDNVPGTEPDVEEEDPVAEPRHGGNAARQAPTTEMPDADQFEKLVAAAQDITDSRVAVQLSRLVQAGALTRRESWDTPRRYEIQTECAKRCKDRDYLAGQWGTLRFLRRDCLGNPSNELAIVISWCLMGLIVEEYLNWELGQLKDKEY